MLRTSGGIMDKKIGLVITIILLITAISTGCFQNEKVGSKGTELVETKGELNSTTGWLDSTSSQSRDGDLIYVTLDNDIPVFLNDTNIFSITFTINFRDYDNAHSGTDQNSPEDYVEATVSSFNATASGTTPCMLSLTIKGNKTDEEQEYFPPELNIHVTGKCYCEITYPLTPRPSALNLYTRDLGVAYEISASYKYHVVK